ncbi:hypothetical protein CSUI_006543 [Cystoisospora suis]|uniref:Uncharacterized protein n=1 Tax=Cystoisospora suis TaxID=483139 RepID=A0A2C6KTQ9_9APIC|nr:hypothetical protein CSUI_006543 [Cystoisospora suis]
MRRRCTPRQNSNSCTSFTSNEIKRSERRLETAAGDLRRAAGCMRTGRS